MKPLYGKGGGGIPGRARDLNFGSLYDLFAATFREPGWCKNFCGGETGR
jgi:glutathione synthase